MFHFESRPILATKMHPFLHRCSAVAWCRSSRADCPGIPSAANWVVFPTVLVEDGPHCIGKYPLVIDQSMKREWFFSMNVCGNFHCHIGLLESTWTSFKKGAWQPICLLCKVTMEHKHLTIPAPVGILTEQYFRDPLHRRVDFDSHQGPNDRPLFVFI